MWLASDNACRPGTGEPARRRRLLTLRAINPRNARILVMPAWRIFPETPAPGKPSRLRRFHVHAARGTVRESPALEQ